MKLLKPSLILLLVIFFISTVTRITLLKTHFGHLDDLGVAVTILDSKRHPPTVNSLLAEGHLRASSPRLQALRQMSENPLGMRVLNALLPVHSYVAVPLVWTYAPLQFIFTSLLINPEQSYETVKFWGRFPSMVSVSFALLFMVALARQIQPQRWVIWSILFVAPLAFSLQISVMAAQMHNYALGIAVAAGILHLTVKDANNVANSTEWKFWFSRLLIWIIALYSIYQSVLLLPGYLIAQVVASWHLSSKQRWTRLIKWCLLGFSISLLFLPAYLFRVRTTVAIGWNAGPNKEFLFQQGGSFISSTLKYFLNNSFVVVGSMFSPAIDESTLFHIWSWIFYILFLSGLSTLVILLFRRDTKVSLKALSCVALGGFAVLILLTLRQQLVLSPTRHLTLFSPAICVFFAYGIYGITSIFKVYRQYCLSICAFAIAIALGITYLTSWPIFKAERQDLFSENFLATLVEAQQADILVSMSREALLMPNLRSKVPVLDLSRSGSYYRLDNGQSQDLSRLKSQSHRILFVGQGPIHRRSCQQIKDFIWTTISIPFNCDSLRPLINKQSDVEVEFSRRTNNGSKGLYVALFDPSSS